MTKSRKTSLTSIIPSLSLLASILLLPLSARAAIETGGCIECHTASAETSKAPYVDISSLKNSVHMDLKCIDCHSDIREVEHIVPGAPPHQRYPERVDCAGQCHQDGNTMGSPGPSLMTDYRDSVHGKARGAGIKDAATCTDCHGRHNIRAKDDPESMVYRTNLPRTCARCHEDMQVVIKHHIHAEKPFQEYEQSVHGKALYRDGLIKVAAICIDCHGVHDIQAAGSPQLRPRRPETCGRCHITILDAYNQGVHGKALVEKKNLDAPVCADCHGEHGISVPSKGHISSICSGCHAEEAIMAKYEIPMDRTVTYERSYHGIANGYGSQTVADCSSCHGFHDILAASDPKSSINPANLVSTCGKSSCHPGISAKVASAKIHIDVTKKESGSAYYVREVFIWALLGLLVITFIWLIPDIANRLRRRGKI